MPEASPLEARLDRFLAGAERASLLTPGMRGDFDRVAVEYADQAELAAGEDVQGVTARVVAVALASGAGAAALSPCPGWPVLRELSASRVGAGWLTIVRFADRVDVGAVLAAMARQVPAGQRDFSPIGFEHTPSDAAVSLAEVTRGGPLTPDRVAGLRTRAGIGVGPEDAPRAVHALARAGVPLTGEPSPRVDPAIGALVGLGAERLASGRQAREEHSIELRRAAWALDPDPAAPAVSVLLATKRPEMVEHALAQIGRQRGVARLEVVLATHGFTVDLARARASLPKGCHVTLAPAEATTCFGDVLAGAAQRADGDVVLKMDDDDWYSPDFVADLLLARRYSGADVVGMPADVQFIEPADTTVRRGTRTECFATFVAGGTLLVPVDLLEEIGGWRSVRRFVDAQLLAGARAAGASIYRTHGLGYLLRRRASGHTWEVDLAELLDPERVAERWSGFVPSRLLELG